MAVDATCCRVMGMDPNKMRYLRIAADRRQTHEAQVEQIGEPIARVRTDFQLIRQFSGLRWKESA